MMNDDSYGKSIMCCLSLSIAAYKWTCGENNKYSELLADSSDKSHNKIMHKSAETFMMMYLLCTTILYHIITEKNTLSDVTVLH